MNSVPLRKMFVEVVRMEGRKDFRALYGEVATFPAFERVIIYQNARLQKHARGCGPHIDVLEMFFSCLSLAGNMQHGREQTTLSVEGSGNRQHILGTLE